MRIASAVLIGITGVVIGLAIANHSAPTATPAPVQAVAAQQAISPATQDCLNRVGYAGASSVPQMALDECESTENATGLPEVVSLECGTNLDCSELDRDRAKAAAPKVTHKQTVSTGKKGTTVTDSTTTKDAHGSTTVTRKSGPSGTTTSTSRTSK